MAKYTIDQVIDAGIRTYSKLGESFTMSDVAKELGTKASSLYRHVQNKRELYYALVTREFDRFNSKIENFAADNQNPNKIIKFVGNLILEIARDDYQLFKLMFLSQPPPASTDTVGPFEQKCTPRTIDDLLWLVRGLPQVDEEDSVNLTFTLMGLVLGSAILTSEVYEELIGGILPQDQYSTFHKYVLDKVGNFLNLD